MLTRVLIILATMNWEHAKAAYAADDAYSAELRRLFGKNAGDVRYTRRGAGEPGTELRRLSDAKLAADERAFNHG